MKKNLLFLFFFLFSTLSWAQQRQQVNGTVKDKENNPIVGATVSVKTQRGVTKTDITGNFSIEVDKGATLQFSYVGMKSVERKVDDTGFVVITLETDNELEEVVVIGYGTVRKKDLTGAVASVTGKDLQSNLAKSTAGALQGRIAGVSVTNSGGAPGAGLNVTVRGLSSFGSNTPLYVVDGVFGDINLVDPNDIASLEVLKDASAAAIYGSRAANGVVIVTTKGGKQNTAATLSVNAFTGIQKVPKMLDLMDATQWKNFQKANGTLPPAAEAMTTNTDWQNEVFRTAPMHKVNVDIAGGGERSTYSVSAGYMKQEGVLLNTDYDAFNLRTKNTFSLFNNHLRLGNTFLIKNGNQQRGSELVITDILRQNPLVPVYDPEILGGYGSYSTWMKNIENPVGVLNLYDNQRHQTDIMLSGYAEVDLFVEGLKYRLNVGANRITGRNYSKKAEPHMYGDQFLQSYLRENAYFNNQWLIENTLHYDRIFDKHTLSVLAGYSAQENNNRGFGVGRMDIPLGTDAIDAAAMDQQSTNGSLQEEALISQFGRLMYSYDSRYLLTATVRRDGSSKFADGRRYGVFPSVALGWNVMNEGFFASVKNTVNEFKIRASYGRLGNQNIGNYTTQFTTQYGINYIQGGKLWLGAIPGYNWVSPIGLTWEETETSDIGLDLAFLNNRLSVSADYYVRETKDILLGINRAPSSGLGGTPVMNAGVISNKGFEFLTSYQDAVGAVNYNIAVNASTVKNTMKAVTVGSVQEFSGFNPHGEGNVTWARVGHPIGGFWLIKTDGLFQSDAEVQAYKSSNGTVIQPNAKAGDIRYVDVNDDGKITDYEDAQYLGSPFPKLAYGIRGNVEYKGVDLGFFFDGVSGNKIYNYTRARMEQTNEVNNHSTSLLNSWTASNTNTDIPRYTRDDPNDNKRRASDRWLESGSFFRLKTLEIGYTLPQNVLNKAALKNTRIFFAADNLFTATKYKGYTPDLGVNSDDNGGGSSMMTAGTDYGRFPLARTIMFGLQASF
ncbi:TonB-dependent receptor [Sphingobacterium sp. UT-1RO-CII-1]|uniref:SusC/RagA family TonB-linked outer membrane protein n=1 Tax=Sphingobacterium sp. UT-1RO-CII-1 TaxID=2995225 RepID=UPI00227D17B7|nr:TonB-dependent receptor [Sphingobacterium sp. UT-1RO-CII-1]MCY4778428.1 TonB-dependent receptor [Sphingobacterium sp. UT-1RO-CII-1]